MITLKLQLPEMGHDFLYVKNQIILVSNVPHCAVSLIRFREERGQNYLS